MMLSNALPRGLSVAGLIILLDQLSKYWIIEKVMRPEGVDGTPFHSATRIEVLPFFDLVMAWNRGVSFGIGNSGGEWNAVILSALAVAICVGMAVWLAKAETLPLQLALGGIIGGALGNVIDRARFGAVADFLDVHVAGYHWPAFNVADSAITIGAVFLIADSLFAGRDSSKN
ncbi:lipoprotein signal peptidase [Paramagnetospirillum caucaseum]|uniref:Lipoprotein signal peptidase n=1 Tax=Paramagnetospirillum caucaseum TaxID=1244869 RepID=M3ABQ7_9PROT|nr:signal peptidase II [Paramagnetospirillum caucaseum]EME70213.1 lipoprotein signal peptidase [Paramagnetospirillum caucaseum]